MSLRPPKRDLSLMTYYIEYDKWQLSLRHLSETGSLPNCTAVLALVEEIDNIHLVPECLFVKLQCKVICYETSTASKD